MPELNLPSFTGSGKTIRSLMGRKGVLRGMKVSHFRDIKDHDKNVDFAAVGITLGSGQEVYGDACIVGEKDWKPKKNQIVDFHKPKEGLSGFLIVVPSQD